MDEDVRPGPPPEPRTESHGGRIRGKAAHDLGASLGHETVVVGERPLHGFEQALLEDGQRRLWRGDGHVAGVGAEGRQRAQRRGAGESARPADDEEMARGVLVVPLGSTRDGE